MATPCFQAKDAMPPVCGVHNVPLVRDRIPIDPNNPQLGQITCYVFPVSREVVADSASRT